MSKDDIELFSDDGSDVQLPSKSNNEGYIANSRTTEEIDNAISGNIVKQVIMTEEERFLEPNYLIDMSSLDEVEEIQMKAIKSLVHPEGDTYIYMALKKGTVRLGSGVADTLDRIIVPAVYNILGENCAVYRNYNQDVANKRLTGSSIGHLRINL